MSLHGRSLQVVFKPTTPPEQVQEYILCASDPVYFLDTHVWIQHKTHGALPFKVWDWQAELVYSYLRERFLIILKARQIGVSELTIGYAFWLIRFHPTKTALITCKNGEDAQELLQRAVFAYDHLPPWLQPGPEAIDGALRGKINAHTLEVLHIDAAGHKNPSAMQSLAPTEKMGRSRAASLLVLDEWAHHQWDVWQGAADSVATGGQVIGISTANGVGNRFHRIWTGAKRKENSFKPIFLSWQKHPDRDTVWYAEKSRNMEEWLLHQEHPQQPEEAFAKSGRPVFSPAVIERHAERVRQEAVPMRELEPGIVLWEEPRPGAEYLIGADVAEGKSDGDYQAAVVIDRTRWVEVAELHGRWPMEDYATKLDKMGHWFNEAEIAVEQNNHGHTVLLALRTGLAHALWSGTEEGYPALYEYEDPLKGNGATLGWVTNSKTKALMVDALGRVLREDTYHPRSLAFLEEAAIFSYLEHGGMGAPAGYHDDLVIARGIVAYIVAHLGAEQQTVAVAASHSSQRRDAWSAPEATSPQRKRHAAGWDADEDEEDEPEEAEKHSWPRAQEDDAARERRRQIANIMRRLGGI